MRRIIKLDDSVPAHVDRFLIPVTDYRLLGNQDKTIHLGVNKNENNPFGCEWKKSFNCIASYQLIRSNKNSAKANDKTSIWASVASKQLDNYF